MLPIYQAIVVSSQELVGGTTLPCVLLVADSEGEIVGDFVVKIPTAKQIEQYQPTNKEVYSSLLAKHFNIKVPPPALVYVSDEIIASLKKHEKYKNRDIKKGYFFGCLYMEDALDYQSHQIKKDDLWKIELIFAFDALIMNRDRVKRKPNVFFKSGDLFAIDHEQAFAISHPFKTYQEKNAWLFLSEGAKGEHLFLEKLRIFAQNEDITFDEFGEYLHTLDPGFLIPYKEQLTSYGHEVEDFVYIQDYLNDARNNITFFQRLLKSLIDPS